MPSTLYTKDPGHYEIKDPVEGKDLVRITPAGVMDGGWKATKGSG